MSRYYTEVSVESTHFQTRNSAWNKKFRSRCYTEFSSEDAFSDKKFSPDQLSYLSKQKMCTRGRLRFTGG